MAEPADIDLTGLCDLHIHTAPDTVPRVCDDLQAAREAAGARMRALLVKSHVTGTADRAALACQVVPAVRLFGGLALNAPVGGLNPAAVEAALKLGAREVWMPTRGTMNENRRQGKPGGLTVLSPEGRILPVVYEIIDMLVRADAILGTGHLSALESATLLRLARSRGLRRMVVTHPEAPFIRMPVTLQAELAEMGAFFERCYVFTEPVAGATITVSDIGAQIRQVGVASTLLSTDLGVTGAPSPVAGMRRYLTALTGAGFSPAELRLMAGENPAGLLDL